MGNRAAQDAQVLKAGWQIPTPIYHFTHAKNLPEILRAGYLHCKARLPTGRQLVNVSHHSVQEKRRNKQVKCAPGGILHDYVPFYFAPRSPMMYVISRGGVEGYDRDTRPFVYLVSSVQSIQEMDLQFAFTDGHPVVALSRFFNDISDLEKIDWQVIEAISWRDTTEDPDKRRRRQAEFLVHQTLPWSAVEFLAVKNANIRDRLERYLANEWPERVKPVRVEPGWYFP